MKKVLTIAGSDCSGGAGIQADLKTFSAYGVFGMSVIASVVAENTFRVIAFQDVRPDMITKQMDAVFEDIPPDAVKIGMLSCSKSMLAVAGKLKELKPVNVVIDPVMYAKNGCALMDPGSINTKNTHGTGCTYSSAIASGLALGSSVNEAVRHAKKYVTTAISHALDIGRGNGPTHHFYEPHRYRMYVLVFNWFFLRSGSGSAA